MIGNPAYPTYQVFLAVGIAALVTGLLMPLFIRVMRHEGVGQQVRADGPQAHLVKQGTPTMGGIVMLLGIVVTVALLAKWTPRWACSTTSSPWRTAARWASPRRRRCSAS